VVASPPDTGERADVSGKPVTVVQIEHVNRYAWAEPRASGRILDVACGTGYGSAMLARRGQVSGLDKESAAVALAHHRAPEIDFRACVLPPIPFPDRTFDVVVTFETLEHIEDDEAYIAEIHRVLKPGGQLLLSTPNAAVSSPGGSPSNPWHVREYTLDGLLALLKDFDGVEVFMQVPVRTDLFARTVLRFVSRFAWLRHPQRFWDRITYGSRAVEPWDGRMQPWYWIIQAHAPLDTRA
jgi:SAM-dependent methyltransferase